MEAKDISFNDTSVPTWLSVGKSYAPPQALVKVHKDSPIESSDTEGKKKRKKHKEHKDHKHKKHRKDKSKSRNDVVEYHSSALSARIESGDQLAAYDSSEDELPVEVQLAAMDPNKKLHFLANGQLLVTEKPETMLIEGNALYTIDRTRDMDLLLYAGYYRSPYEEMPAVQGGRLVAATTGDIFTTMNKVIDKHKEKITQSKETRYWYGGVGKWTTIHTTAMRVYQYVAERFDVFKLDFISFPDYSEEFVRYRPTSYIIQYMQEHQIEKISDAEIAQMEYMRLMRYYANTNQLTSNTFYALMFVKIQAKLAILQLSANCRHLSSKGQDVFSRRAVLDKQVTILTNILDTWKPSNIYQVNAFYEVCISLYKQLFGYEDLQSKLGDLHDAHPSYLLLLQRVFSASTIFHHCDHHKLCASIDGIYHTSFEKLKNLIAGHEFSYQLTPSKASKVSIQKLQRHLNCLFIDRLYLYAQFEQCYGHTEQVVALVQVSSPALLVALLYLADSLPSLSLSLHAGNLVDTLPYPD
jgi:hypothetical protein